MTEFELRQYLLREYPQENARCGWKELKNLNSFCRGEKDDVISYVSAIANMILRKGTINFSNLMIESN